MGTASTLVNGWKVVRVEGRGFAVEPHDPDLVALAEPLPRHLRTAGVCKRRADALTLARDDTRGARWVLTERLAGREVW